MPRKPIDWSKCMFYRLVCRDPTITDYYVGSTCNEVDRRYKHKHACTNPKSNKHNYFVYRFIREHGSWDNWQLIVHEKLPMNNEHEAAIRERYWVEQYNAKLNKQVPSRTKAQYHVDHAEEINARSAAWHLAHSDQLKEKHTCECGGRFTTAYKNDHLKTKKHTAFEAAK